MGRVKLKCPVCKRTRGTLNSRDWELHKEKCKSEAALRASTPSMRQFMVPQTSPTSSPPAVEALALAPGEGDDDASCLVSGVNLDGDGVGGSGVADACATCEGGEDGYDVMGYGDGGLPLDVQLHVDDSDVEMEMAEAGGGSSSLTFSPGTRFGHAGGGAGTSTPQSSTDCSDANCPTSHQHQLFSPTVTVASSSPGAADGLEEIDSDTQSEKSDGDSPNPVQFTADPATFCKIQTFTSEMVDKIQKCGPHQPVAADLASPNHEFPQTNGRSFRPSWYFRRLPDGSEQKRDWLSYSEKNDAVFCIHCILFSKSHHRAKHPSFISEGFNTWFRATTAFLYHETSEMHVEAALAANLRKLSLPLNAQMERAKLTKKAENREIVRQLVDITLYLARHCLAFRGHREGAKNDIRGNFHDLVTLLAKYSPGLATYLTKLQEKCKSRKGKLKRKPRNFFSWNRQNQYIQAVAQYIKNSAKKEVQEARFFSVSLDETFDFSRKEQCSCIIRYVNENTGTVCERLVALKVSASTTGEQLFNVLVNILEEELGLDWKNYLVGQTYDGASNMRGQYQGLQARIREEAASAIYIWCYAHRLNLAVKDCVNSCVEAVDMFNNIKALGNFINCNKLHVDLYEKYFIKYYPGKQTLRLKRVDTTRWNSYDFSLSTVVEAFDAVVDTLVDIEANGINSDAKITASGLLKYFISEQFVLVSQTFLSIFDVITPLSRGLQAADVDMMAAVNHVNSVMSHLTAMRSDEAFQTLLEKKNDFIQKHDEIVFKELPTPTEKRVRRVRRRDGEQAHDTPIVDALTKFRVETYFASLDNIIQLLTERFSDRAQGVLKDISLFTRKRMSEVERNKSVLPDDAFKAFCAVYAKFVNVEDLRREYLQMCKTFEPYESALNLPKNLHSDAADWIDIDECEEVAIDDGHDADVDDDSVAEELRTAAADPPPVTNEQALHSFEISSASTERSFSKLKLIKNRLRTTMLQGRLEDLMIISCENDVQIDVEEVLKILASFSPYLSALLF
ncbi:Zinc finger MYM-type protein 1 [Frankliniella fusca]|uniref:Zinc finger MYM-type protein 1 n=1 Tax=Frankliniella fusca TaxID=407009 RepID=A0AAE1GQY4_9NEOP|nr:Zinc finger MYM-type protein 1 [Frankliniella fusca]